MRASRLVPCLLVLTLSPLLFSSSGRDDSYITYGAARSLATQGQIRNYNGAPVEQSSTLLQVMLIGTAARILPWPIPEIGTLLSLGCGALAVLLTHHLAFVLRPSAAFPASILVALSSSLLYWSASGMESTLAACATLWFLLVAYRWLETGSGSYPAAFVVAVVWFSVRPENTFVFAATVSALAACAWFRQRDKGATTSTATPPSLGALGAFVATAMAAVVALLAVRLLYFHSAFPQPVYAKSGGFSLASIAGGLGYLARSALMRPTALLWILCAAGIARTLRCSRVDEPADALALLLSCFVSTYLGFVVCAGGDWMEAGRFLVPVLPVVIILAMAVLWDTTGGRVRVVTTATLAFLQLADTALLFRSPQNFGGPLWSHLQRPTEDERLSWFEQANELHAGYTDLIPALEGVIDGIRNRRPGVPVSVLTGQMGMVPYHVVQRRPGVVRWVDIYGLTDRSLTSCPATHDLERGPYGLAMSYGEFFQRRSRIRSTCDFADPDVIFDRAPNRDFEAMLTQNGYAVVFVEKKRWLQWIAVRQDLS